VLLLLEVFSGAALLLTAIGIYGTLSYWVVQRPRELGIRRALGAQTENLLALVVGKGMLLTAAGIIVGTACAIGLTRVLQKLLFQISPTDEGAWRHVATEGFCVARVAGSGSWCPQYAQFAQVGSTALSHFGHVGCSKVPQRGQNGNFAFSTCPQPGHVFGSGSRRMKYKIIPIAWGTKIASSVHITYRICRRFASP
jgi:ABC-type antimicrobial peptide transport system permease subunit